MSEFDCDRCHQTNTSVVSRWCDACRNLEAGGLPLGGRVSSPGREPARHLHRGWTG